MEKSLRQFLAVAEMKSLSHAAKRLFVTQPTLTHSIKKLEQTLGVDLFVRSSKGMELTPYGELLLEKARVMRRVHDNAMAEMAEFKAQRQRGIRLGVGMAWWHLFFRDLIRDYREAHPTVPIHIELGNHLRSMDQLLSGDIDLSVGHQITGLNERSGAQFLPLFTCSDAAFVRQGHPLTQQRRYTWQDLLDYPHLDITPDESRYHQVLSDQKLMARERSDYHLRKRVLWSTSSMSAGIDILRESDAVMTYTSTMAGYFTAQGLAELEVVFPARSNVGIYRLRERGDEHALQHMVALIQATVASIDLPAQRLQEATNEGWQ